MSFVARGIKKIFKTVKKVVKSTMSFAKRLVKSDWFKVAAIVALSVFTAGVASGGFAAFNGVQTLSGFFGAVGQTMATGFTAITGAIAKAGSAFTSMFSGATPTAGVAAQGTAATMTTAEALAPVTVSATMQAGGSVTAAQIAQMSTAEMVGAHVLAGGAAEAIGAAAGAGAAGGVLSKMAGLFMSDSVGGSMLRTGVIMGIMNYQQAKQAEKEEHYWRNRTIWGGPAFGGSEEGMNFGVPTQTPAGGYSDFMQGAPQEPTYVQQLLGSNDPNSIQWNPNQVAPDQQGLLAGPQQQYQQPQIANTGVPAQQTQPPPMAPQQGRQERPPQPNIVQLENAGVM